MEKHGKVSCGNSGVTVVLGLGPGIVTYIPPQPQLRAHVTEMSIDATRCHCTPSQLYLSFYSESVNEFFFKHLLFTGAALHHFFLLHDVCAEEVSACCQIYQYI